VFVILPIIALFFKMSSPASNNVNTATTSLSLVKTDPVTGATSVVKIPTTTATTPSKYPLLCSSPGECEKCEILEQKLHEMTAVADRYSQLYRSAQEKSKGNSEESIKIIKEVTASLDKLRSMHSFNTDDMHSFERLSEKWDLSHRFHTNHALAALYQTRSVKRKERDE
jgi:hypothetical protein